MVTCDVASMDRLAALGCRSVTIGAQAYLLDWYARFGFERAGPRYLEDGILHVPMHLDLAPGHLVIAEGFHRALGATEDSTAQPTPAVGTP
mgnify:CR=1 FL=1